MNRIRLLVVLLIFMLFVFFSIERPLRMINICRAAYVFTALMAVVGVIVRRGPRAPLWAMLIVPVPFFLLVKKLEGDTLWGAGLPLTVMEIGIIGITTILASWVSNAMTEFEQAVAHITIGPVGLRLDTSSKDQAEMYREMRRARHHERPLSLVAVDIEQSSIQVALDRLVKETQATLMKRYVMADVARTLCSELEDYNLIARSDDHFLILLPEVSHDKLPAVTDRLRQAVQKQVGVDLRFGTASFPGSATTFEGLIDVAVGQVTVHAATSREPLADHTQPSPLLARHHEEGTLS